MNNLLVIEGTLSLSSAGKPTNEMVHGPCAHLGLHDNIVDTESEYPVYFHDFSGHLVRLKFIVKVQGPLYPFAKQPLNLKFVNADCYLTKIFANCKFNTPISSFQDILHNFLFVSVSEETPRKKRKWSRTCRHGHDRAIRKYFLIVNYLTTHHVQQ
jgi:hypothetical protein